MRSNSNPRMVVLFLSYLNKPMKHFMEIIHKSSITYKIWVYLERSVSSFFILVQNTQDCILTQTHHQLCNTCYLFHDAKYKWTFISSLIIYTYNVQLKTVYRYTCEYSKSVICKSLTEYILTQFNAMRGRGRVLRVIDLNV